MTFHVLSRRPCRRLSDARGFTVVEMLVVVLIIAILAMVALPAYLNQRAKGEDTEAQAMVRAVHTALVAHHTGEGTYDATEAQLRAIEPAVGEASPALEVTGTEDGFAITERSASGTTFTFVRTASGDIERTCSDHGRGLCRSTRNAAGNWW